MSPPTKRPERRKKKRIALTRGVIARFGTIGVIMIDASESGARVEHFMRFEIGKKARLRFEWNDAELEVEACVMSCKVHRFIHGEKGATVYQSGLQFVDFIGNSQDKLKEMVSTSVARSLAEQVANARGLGPIIEQNMPVFRSGVVTAAGLDPKSAQKAERLLPKSEIVVDRGYIRCTLINGLKWDKKWSRTPEQPQQGFTVRATEPSDHIDQLCDTYLHSGEEQRKLIKLLAEVSTEKSEETPEPR